ncbi:hypothetical protein ABZ370_33695 [Streptomyces sp. NPDC005962]|uniref:hypothetical protein n=1 Tax=Streptomyces sp. NPDC005962 TaxID=3154466 RepID=UPI0034040EC3
MSRLEKSARERSLELFHTVINGMDMHAKFGHPGDSRYPGRDAFSAEVEVHSQAKKRTDMLECTGVTPLPLEGVLAELLKSSHPPENPFETLRDLGPFAMCELGEAHEGAHADHIWSEDHDDAAVWLLWDDNGHRFERIQWCGTSTDGGNEHCHLYLKHPVNHSWAVADPSREALREQLMRDMDRWQL